MSEQTIFLGVGELDIAWYGEDIEIMVGNQEMELHELLQPYIGQRVQLRVTVDPHPLQQNSPSGIAAYDYDTEGLGGT